MKTDRAKHPECRWCGRTLQRTKDPTTNGWRHKHTKQIMCSRNPVHTARPTDDWEVLYGKK